MLPILEVAAKHGAVETFKLLQEHGAPIRKRILHRAVEAAAWAKTPDRLAQRMVMVRYLVEEVGLDVNGMDEEGRPNFYGTPVNYAAHSGGGKEVVEYLLQVCFLAIKPFSGSSNIEEACCFENHAL